MSGTATEETAAEEAGGDATAAGRREPSTGRVGRWRLSRRRPAGRHQRICAWAALTLLVGLIGGCAEEPLPQRRLSPDDCLREVRMDALDESLRRCDRVVSAFPRDPQPLNERFLIHTLRGDTQKACQDIAAAAKLAAALPADRLDPLLRNDLRLRVESCRE